MSDVRLDPNDFVDLRDGALSFVPAIMEYRARRHLPAQSLVNVRRLLEEDEQIGWDVVRKALRGSPVKYFKAAGLVSAFNIVMGDKGQKAKLNRINIVVAAFVFEDLKGLVDALGLSPGALASESGLDVEVIHSALEHYRLTFVVASKILNALERVARMEKYSKTPDPLVRKLRAGHKFEFITTRPRVGRRAVKFLARNESLGPVPVLRGIDISAAPLAGHPWALRDSPPKNRKKDGKRRDSSTPRR